MFWKVKQTVRSSLTITRCSRVGHFVQAKMILTRTRFLNSFLLNLGTLFHSSTFKLESLTYYLQTTPLGKEILWPKICSVLFEGEGMIPILSLPDFCLRCQEGDGNISLFFFFCNLPLSFSMNSTAYLAQKIIINVQWSSAALLLKFSNTDKFVFIKNDDHNTCELFQCLRHVYA